jgi:eukaryotic-like serine/threonine-protein kinase
VAFWERLTKRPSSGSTSPPPAGRGSSPAPDASEPPELTRLRQVGAAGGPAEEEACALFRVLRASADEARAIDALRSVASSRAIPESLRVAVSAALADRGAPEEALALVSAPNGVGSSPEARVLAADLYAERGEIPEALALIERVLVVDLDYPGARERHRRWRTLLGLDPSAGPRPDPSAATLVAREPDSPFLLLREVARGGAGAVYEAEDRELLRLVALKVYHQPERDRDQLLHEARVAASLAGRGIIRVLDVDPEHGWLALDWAPLGSLRQHLRAKDPSILSPIGRWAIPLATAIARVHAAGWVHHDLKPANVLLAAPERPILADFGTARRVGEPSPPGSLGYVSPERLAGRASDPRDDVFGFGRILEDVLAALAPTPLRGSAGWREIAAVATGPDAGRPSDARALLTRLRVEAG